MALGLLCNLEITIVYKSSSSISCCYPTSLSPILVPLDIHSRFPGAVDDTHLDAAKLHKGAGTFALDGVGPQPSLVRAIPETAANRSDADGDWQHCDPRNYALISSQWTRKYFSNQWKYFNSPFFESHLYPVSGVQIDNKLIYLKSKIKLNSEN